MPFYAGPDEPDRITLATRTLQAIHTTIPAEPMIFTVRLSARLSGAQGVTDLRVDLSYAQKGQPNREFSQRPKGRDLIEQFCGAASLLHGFTAMHAADCRLLTLDGTPFELDHSIFAFAEGVRDALDSNEPPDPRWAT
jgi:hypothetical protein